MADRYWVGGTASWDGTAGTKWSTTSGGAGGASIPTTADDVFFDASSSGTCTIATGNTGAKSINCTGFTGAITGSAAITVAGSVTLVAGMTYTHTGTMTISGTGTLTTAGKTFSGIIVSGSGITVTLGDALTTATLSEITVSQGTFDTANYNVTCRRISSANTNTRTITLGSSTVTITHPSSGIDFSADTGLTFNAGTSQINISGANGLIATASGQTFYNVSYTSTSTGSRQVSGVNTFNNLTLIASATGLSQFVINNDQTVSGTFTCAGSSVIQRGFVRASPLGTTRTITANAISADDCDFRDITITGAAEDSSPTRAGDCGGNSGIIFPAAKTVYWNLAGSQTWNATGWATSSSGSPAADNFPLAQDTATFTDSGSADTVNFGSIIYNISAINASGRTSAMTLSITTQFIHGSVRFGSGLTITGAGTPTFLGRGLTEITCAGKSFPGAVGFNTIIGTVKFLDHFSSNGALSLTSGTIDANDYNVTVSGFGSAGGLSRTLNMKSGLWTITGSGTTWNVTDITNFTLNKDTANILFSNNTTSLRIFNGGNLVYNKLTIGGTTSTSTTQLISLLSLLELESTKTVAHTVQLTNNIGTISKWSVTGTSGNVVTVNSSVSGTSRALNISQITTGIDYLDVKDINVPQPNRFYVGVNSTNSGNNTNVIFTAAPAAPPTGSSFFVLL